MAEYNKNRISRQSKKQQKKIHASRLKEERAGQKEQERAQKAKKKPSKAFRLGQNEKNPVRPERSSKYKRGEAEFSPYHGREQNSAQPSGENPDLHVIKGGREKKAVRRVRLIAALCIIAALAFGVVYFNSVAPGGLMEYFTNAYAAYGNGDGYPVRVQGGGVHNIEAAGDRLFALSDTMLSCYNENGKLIFSRNHSYASPAAEIRPGRAMVYDRGNKQFMVMSLTGLIYSGKTDYNLLTAALGYDGSFAAATRSRLNMAEVTLYSREGDMIFKWLSANDLITALAISRDGSSLLVATVSAENAKYKTTLRLFDKKKDEPVKTAVLDNVMITHISERDNGQLTLLGNSALYSMPDMKTLECKQYSFAGRQAICYNMTGEDTVLALSAADSSAATVIVLDSGLNARMEMTLDEQPKSCAVSEDILYIAIKNEILAYNFSKVLAKRQEIGYDIKYVLPVFGKMAVLHQSSVMFVSP